LKELREARRDSDRPPREQQDTQATPENEGQERTAKAAIHEMELLEVLLADPSAVARAQAEIGPEDIEHPGLRLLVEGLYRLHAEGLTPTLDLLRARIDKPRLLEKALELQERGLAKPNRQDLFDDVLARFREKRAKLAKQQLYGQLRTASDHNAALELLRKLQNQTG
jgi:hypothetical protein